MAFFMLPTDQKRLILHCIPSVVGRSFEGHTFSSSIELTFVNGQLVFDNGRIITDVRGQQVEVS